jgi:hypothetical protein
VASNHVGTGTNRRLETGAPKTWCVVLELEENWVLKVVVERPCWKAPPWLRDRPKRTCGL